MLESIDDHIIDKHDMLIRPGASRRVSFRGTPGGKVSLRVGAKKGPDLGDTEEPVDEDPSRIAVGDLMPPALGRGSALDPPARRIPPARQEEDRARALLVEALLAGAVGRQIEETPPSDAGVIFLAKPPIPRPSILTHGRIDDLIVLEPDLPDIPPLPPLPRPPIDVRIALENGPTLKSETLAPDFPKLGRLQAGPFGGNDVIDVTFSNPNDFPVLLFAFINIQNDLDITTTTLPGSLVERVFGNSLLFLAPTFGIRDGKLRFAFSEEVMDTFGLEPVTKDLGLDADVTVSIEPIRFELLDHETVVERVVTEMEAEVRAVRAGLFQPDLPRVPADFVTRAVDTFFSPTGTLPFLFEEQMELKDVQWKRALERRPLLGGHPSLVGFRDDVALGFHLRVTEISAGASRLRVNVDTITATLYVALRSGGRPEPHPVRRLRDDFVRAGFVVPHFDLKVDVGGIDVDLDLGGGVFTKPFEFVAEEALEEVADWLKDNLEDEAVEEGMAYLLDAQLAIGELGTSIMREIANRSHVFRRLQTDGTNWRIETLDTSQLAVPFVEPDGIDHRFDDIDVNEPALEPIDGPMPADAAQRLGRVDHLVFLMMENRSFDHMLGYLSHPNHGARSDIDGLDGRSVLLGGDFAGTRATPQPGPRLRFVPDPPHGASAVAAQIADGAMDGFVSEFAHRLEASDEINPRGNLNDPERVLRFYTADQLEAFDDLSRTDLILDRWFSSIPGPTYPNRMCYYSGFTPNMSNSEVFDDAGYHTDLTVFDVLNRAGVDWTVYESDLTFLRMFERFRLDTSRIRPIEEFFARTQALPRVTFVDPDFTGAPGSGPTNDDHPPTDITAGQEFIARVIDTLQGLPSWPTTMLVITYDEHGGFADHVPPPGSPTSDFPPAPDGSATVPLAHPDAATFGVRVPTFVVSPVITAGGAGHAIYDHATVYRTILERFTPGLRNSAIIPERVRRARHLGELVEPGIDTGNLQPRVSNMQGRLNSVAFAARREPDAVIARNTDDLRPHLAAPPDTEDFHHYMTRLGNPLKRR
jgi:phospholipase C